MFNRRHEQIAIHPRVEKGKFSTLAEHIAATKINGIERGAKYLLQRAKLIGPQSASWAEKALSEHGVQGMRKFKASLVSLVNMTVERLNGLRKSPHAIKAIAAVP